MSTTPDTARLAALGVRFRASYLVQQAGYTLGLATAEGAALAALLPADHLAKTAQLRDDVTLAMQDKTVRAAEAKQATRAQNGQMRASIVWVRKVGRRCQNAIHLGVALPPELTRVGRPTAVPLMLEQISTTLAVLGDRAADMDRVGPPTQPLIDEGRQLHEALERADTLQERSRAADLPAAVTAFYVKKAELYGALKIINNAGHELYAHDLGTASRFNLSILQRRGTSPAEPPAPEPAASVPRI
jgi:hypothetical protein